MRTLKKIQFSALTALWSAISLGLLFTAPAQVQPGIDLVVHHVEGTPSENRIAYDVKIYLTVVDGAGNPLKDLTGNDFTVTEDSRKVELEKVAIVQDEPIHLVLLMDTSGSMRGTGITAAKAAASGFINSQGGEDLISLAAFEEVLTVLTDFTRDHQAVQDQITSMDARQDAGTCLYDAAYQAVKMTATVPAGRRAVILFTDGVDEKKSGGTCSVHSADDVIDLATADGTRTPVYALALGKRVDQNALKRLAENSGGRFLYSPDASQLDNVFQRLSDSLRSQYELRYTSLAGPGSHVIAVTGKALDSQDTDTRSFLLPAMPTRVSFTSPGAGEEVHGPITLAVSITGQGETVDRVDFEADGEVIGTDNTMPYEIEVDPRSFGIGEITLAAIVYNASNTELARTSIRVKPVPADVVPTPTAAPVANSVLVVGGGIGGLVVIIVAIFALIVVRRRHREKELDEAWAKAQASVDISDVSLGGDRTFDGWEPSPDALGMLTVTASDDVTMIGQRFAITKPVTSLGRSTDNDISFPKDNPVSRRHAQIEEKKGGLFLSQQAEVTDPSGQMKWPTYGTYVNDIELGTDAILLQTGDEIRLGKRVHLRFEAINRPGGRELTYDGFDNPGDDLEKTRYQ